MAIFGGGDSDWSDALALSIWNCGGNNGWTPDGKRSSKVRYEGRNESSSRLSRGGGATAERDAPVTKDVMIL